MPQDEARPTQEFVEIQSIERGVITLKNGGLRQILLVAGINFDLKSEDEQQIILSAYRNLLNELHFSLQFFLHSRHLNIDAYLESLNTRLVEEKNELLRNQITEYVQFVRDFVAKNPIMTKTFFVVVPFDPTILSGAGVTGPTSIFNFFKHGGNAATSPEESHARKEHLEQLAQRVNQITTALLRIGIRAIPLQDEEIVDLFYNLYNPEARERKAQTPTDRENIKA